MLVRMARQQNSLTPRLFIASGKISPFGETQEQAMPGVKTSSRWSIHIPMEGLCGPGS